MEGDDPRAAAELGRLDAETEKLRVETEKLDVEARRLRQSINADFVKLGLALFAAGFAAVELAHRLGWLQEWRTMFERHEVLPSGRKAERDWWITTKMLIVVVVAVGAAYLVHTLIHL